MSREVNYLKDRLTGAILKIQDPRQHAVEDILKSYFREILVIARKYVRPSVEFEDLVTEGIMGLLDAIRRWDPEKANGNERSFHNLAIVRIKSNMFEYFLANNSMYTIPSYMGRAMALVEQLRNAVDAYEHPLDTDAILLTFEFPEFEEFIPADHAEKIRVLKEKLLNLAQSMKLSYTEIVQRVLKTEDEIEAYENETEAFEPSPEEITERKEYLTKILAGLKPDARDVLTSLLEGETLEQAGKQKGFTRERARQIKEATLEYLQKTRMFKDATEE